MPFLEIRRFEILAAQRPAASMALRIAALGQVAIDGHPVIEYETFADPADCPSHLQSRDS